VNHQYVTCRAVLVVVVVVVVVAAAAAISSSLSSSSKTFYESKFLYYTYALYSQLPFMK
jgi:type II secretory pathway pseudopilin PulG